MACFSSAQLKKFTEKRITQVWFTSWAAVPCRCRCRLLDGLIAALS